jgi:dienelactone hydrolase
MRTLLLLLVACESGTITIEDADSAAVADSDTPETPPGGADTEDSPTDTPPGPTDTEEPGGDTEQPPAALGDLSLEGPSAVDVTESRFATADCTLEYRKFAPQDPAAVDVAVVLTHGFMRNREQMRGWARHLASWGLTVYTPNLCHATFIDANHPKNGEELAAFANTHLQGSRVLYIGHSAGGLASVLAATHDPDALGVLTLDLVDTENLGLQAAPGLRLPVYGLVGDPSWACNSDGNGIPALQAAPDHTLLRVTDAVHCDFESPTDSGCTTVCGWQFPGPAFTDRQQEKAIQALIAGFALGVSGVDSRALETWMPGRAAYDDLARSGVVTGI